MSLPVRYKEVSLDCGYRIDFIVDEKVILELKSVETVTNVHESQLITYLKLSGLRIGLILNFNMVRLHEGITRRVL